MHFLSSYPFFTTVALLIMVAIYHFRIVLVSSLLPLEFIHRPSIHIIISPTLTPEGPLEEPLNGLHMCEQNKTRFSLSDIA